MADKEYDPNVIVFCTSCLSTIPIYMAEKDIFLQAGKNGICKFCKGPTVVTYADQLERYRENPPKL